MIKNITDLETQDIIRKFQKENYSYSECTLYEYEMKEMTSKMILKDKKIMYNSIIHSFRVTQALKNRIQIRRVYYVYINLIGKNTLNTTIFYIRMNTANIITTMEKGPRCPMR